MQLRYKKKCTLKKVTYEKQANGVKVASYSLIKDYIIDKQEITDEISASIYGADINNMLRITSIKYELEKYLKEKVNNNSDNVSNYIIDYNNKIYKIVSVKEKYIDLKEITN